MGAVERTGNENGDTVLPAAERASRPPSLGTKAHSFTEKRKQPRVREEPVNPPPPAKLHDYEPLLGETGIEELRYLAQALRGRSVKLVNAPYLESYAAEMLSRLVSLLTELEVVTNWEPMTGNSDFATVAKMFRRALQGAPGYLSKEMRDIYLSQTDDYRDRTRFEEDVVVLHDPEPLSLIRERTGKHQHWVWRCHIDLSNPNAEFWDFLRPFVDSHDAAVFSSQVFTHQLPIPQYLFYPCIDPLSDKNKQLEPSYIQQVCDEFGIDRSRAVITQVSPLEHAKDPLGVIAAYRLAKKYVDCQLVLAGSANSDDSSSSEMIADVMEAVDGDPDILVLNLPVWSAAEVNAIQSASRIIVQKSTREGFGTTVTEALWKGKPVIASAVGGIPNQVIHKFTGALVHSVEGCAYQIRYLLTHQEFAEQLGKNGREHVQENFLITSDVKRWLLLLQILMKVARR
jgi:trehalose synthase